MGVVCLHVYRVCVFTFHLQGAVLGMLYVY